jgi:hypothetical protein
MYSVSLGLMNSDQRKPPNTPNTPNTQIWIGEFCEFGGAL